LLINHAFKLIHNFSPSVFQHVSYHSVLYLTFHIKQIKEFGNTICYMYAKYLLFHLLLKLHSSKVTLWYSTTSTKKKVPIKFIYDSSDMNNAMAH